MHRWRAVLWTAIAVALVLDLVRLPTQPASAALDASWNACLVDAAAKHLQVGRDVVFTYGPLGHLLAYCHIGQPMRGRMLFECGFVILTVLGIVACAMRLPGRWAAALVFAAGFGPAIEYRDVPVGISLACWAVTCHVAGPRPGAAAALGLGLLVGSAALLKFSWCVAGGFTALAIGADFALRRQWAAAAILAATAAGSASVLWLASGQPAAGCGDYLRTALEVADGFARTMASPCTPGKLVAGVVVLACIAMAVSAAAAPAGHGAGARRALFAAWAAAFTFVTWKHGFVRADFGHLLCFHGVACVLPVALMALPPATPRMAFARRGAALIALIVLLGTWHKSPILETLGRPFLAATATVRHVVDPGRYDRAVAAAWDRSRARLALPDVVAVVGDDSVDVFGFQQTYALANGLTYTPRPVFQSYVACTPELARLNGDFYRSERPPTWVLFDLAPIDGRLPALEDSQCLVEILHAYRLASEPDPFLLLRRLDDAGPLGRELAQRGVGTVGTPVDLRRHLDHDVWLEIDVRSGPLAAVRTALVRQPGLRIRMTPDRPATAAAGETPAFSAAPIMLAAGFLASPLCESKADVVALVRGAEPRRAAGFTLEPGPDGRALDGAAFEYRIYHLTPGLSRPPVAPHPEQGHGDSPASRRAAEGHEEFVPARGVEAAFLEADQPQIAQVADDGAE